MPESTTQKHKPINPSKVAWHLANLLECECEFVRTDHHLSKIKCDGFEIWLRLQEVYHDKGKGRASYNRPMTSDRERVTVWDTTTNRNEIPDPSIGFSLSKDAYSVACDIARRLVPDIRALHPLVLLKIKEAEDYKLRVKETQEFVEKLGSIKGVGFRSSGTNIQIEGYVDRDVAMFIHTALAKKYTTK